MEMTIICFQTSKYETKVRTCGITGDFCGEVEAFQDIIIKSLMDQKRTNSDYDLYPIPSYSSIWNQIVRGDSSLSSYPLLRCNQGYH
jgi:hypothetical protein